MEFYDNEVMYCEEGELMPWAGPEAGWYVFSGPMDEPDANDIRGPFATREEAEASIN